jgi:diguanylate cyclase (GGDEF)-like protein/PAS domain S-box-containing protein
MAERDGRKEGLSEEFTGNAPLAEALLEGSPVGILLVDKEYAVRYVNPVLRRWIGRPETEVIGGKCYEILFGNKQPCVDGEKICPSAGALGHGGVTGPVTFPRQGSEGARQVLRIHAHPVPDKGGGPSFAAEFIQDVTSEVLLRDCREEAALRDPLTGLYNRQGFNLLLGRELGRTRRQGHPLSLCLIDLDSFKDYNEKNGEKAGDELLVRLAGILLQQTRVEVDALCRLQADNFALVLPEASHAQAVRICDRIRRAAEAGRLPISFSMAVCECKEPEDADGFFRRSADLLFQAKKTGGNKTRVDNP